MEKFISFVAVILCLVAVISFGSFVFSPVVETGIPAPPTGDYLNVAIIASVAALAVIALLLVMKRRGNGK